MMSIQKLTEAQYRAHPAISRSALAEFMRSPQRYHAIYIHGRGTRETDAMKFGSQFHTHLLEPHLFNQLYFVYDKINWTTKEGKAQRDDVESREKEGGQKCLTMDEYEDIRLMSDSFQLAMPAGTLEKAQLEICIFWTDPDTGLDLKARLDMVIDKDVPEHFVWDIKTAADISITEFSWALFKYNLHMQAAFYLDGWSAVTGIKCNTFGFAAFEKTAPYAVATYFLSDKDGEESKPTVDMGRSIYKKELAKLKTYLEEPWRFLAPREICLPEKALEIQMGRYDYV